MQILRQKQRKAKLYKYLLQKKISGKQGKLPMG